MSLKSEGIAVGMDLSGAGGYFGCSNAGWADILELGQLHGWVPTGTGPPRGILKEEWEDGGYFGNDGQLFYARDARQLADALERALTVAPSAGSGKTRTRTAQPTDYLEAELAGRKKPKGGRMKVREPDPERAKSIREFIEFCRAGSFRIC